MLTNTYVMMVVWLSVLLIVVIPVKTETCTTPNGQIGECIESKLCPGVIQILANYGNGTEAVLKQLFCGKYGFVCCPPHWNSTLYNEELSDRRYCGYQRKDDYPSETTGIAIDEFPWSAALVFVNLRDPEADANIKCQGTLINNRYVLTAAHCCTDRYLKITRIRLGEFNINNDTDCVEVPRYGSEDCSTVEEFAIEEVIPHYFYSRLTGHNDICLIRLNGSVAYTDYVRPICLPTPGTTFAKPGNLLYATGWGETMFSSISKLKKKISTTLITNEECVEKLKNARGPVHITPYRMCTIDQPNKNEDFTCRGDGGGPAMFSSKNQWHIEGIVSTGIGCGSGYPEIHTRVSGYLNWIRQNLRP